VFATRTYVAEHYIDDIAPDVDVAELPATHDDIPVISELHGTHPHNPPAVLATNAIAPAPLDAAGAIVP